MQEFKIFFEKCFFYISVFRFLPVLAGAVETVLVPELVDSSSLIAPFLITVKNRAQINKSMFYQKIICVKNNLEISKPKFEGFNAQKLS